MSKPAKMWKSEPGGRAMTDNTQELDVILEDFYDGDIRQSDMGKAKQALTSLIKELVAEAKPGRADTQIWRENPDDAWDMAIDQFEQNLLKALEEVI